MKKIARQFVAVMLVLLTMSTMCADVFCAEGYRTLYAEDGRSKAFPVSQVAAQLTVGWYTEPVQRLYAPGKSKVFPKSQVAAQITVGWSAEPFVLMYALDGRSKYVKNSLVEANKKVGWYVGKPIKAYAEDGRTKYIGSGEIAANEKVGWYTEPVQRLYAPGKSKVFPKSQVAAQLTVGWYTYPVTRIYSEKGEIAVVKTAELKSWLAKGWDTSVIRVVKEDTNTAYINNWGHVSSVQQFKYLNQGIAYGYMSGKTLVIVTPAKEIKINSSYEMLGDINSDLNGNFYVVWGNENKGDDYSKNTVFISKYNSNGAHIKTTGFKGVSKMGDSGNTKKPFDAGNCHSAIANGIMMVNYARGMYSGHQSNNVVGVYTDTMKPYEFPSEWAIPYTSHSFNQRIIWSKFANNFVYADHGDAYDRGFIITLGNDVKSFEIFNFYLPANADYNMYVVNKTYAQMGSLLETSKGVVLVGASVKSISSNADKEKHNLFVQIFNPNASKVSKDMFVGGQNRSGATSFDINDNKNSPLTPVTNYGVNWLTNYTDADVVAPHAVVAGDRIVILWNQGKTDKQRYQWYQPSDKGDCQAYYMILSADGKIIKPATALDKSWSLNSMEDPIYHYGKVYWACTENNRVVLRSITVD